MTYKMPARSGIVNVNDEGLADLGTAPLFDAMLEMRRAGFQPASDLPIGADVATPVVTIAPPVFGPSGGEFLVNTTVAGSQGAPVIIMLNDGQMVMAWQDNDDVKGRIYSAAGVAGAEFTISSETANGQGILALTALTGGGFAATWQDASGTLGDAAFTSIKARVFDSSGTALGGEFLVNTTTAGAQTGPRITALDGNGFAIAWTDESNQAGDPSFRGVIGRIFDGNGTAVTGQFLVNQNTTFDQFVTSMTKLSDGRFVVAWTDLSNTLGDASFSSVKARIFSATGTPLTGDFLVATQTLNEQRNAVVVAFGTGFLMAWEDGSKLGGDTSGYGIKAQIFDASGAKIGSEFLVNSQTYGDQLAPKIAVQADGSFVVTWQDASLNYGDISGTSIKARNFSAAGVPLTDDYLVNQQTGSAQTVPVVLARPSGGYLFVWQDNSGTLGDASSNSVKARYFEKPTFLATEQVPTSLKGAIAFSDPDADSGAIETATLKVDFGILQVTAGDSGATIVSGDGTGTVVIRGTLAQINALLGAASSSVVQYIANSDTPQASATLTFEVDDGTAIGSTTAPIIIAPANDITAVTFSSPTTAWTETKNGTNVAVVIDAGLTLSDPDSVPTGAIIQIAGATSQDVLALSATSGIGNITVTTNVPGYMVLTSSGGTATLAQWQTALRSITYNNNSNTPGTADRVIDFSLTDYQAGTATKTVHINAVADANFTRIADPIGNLGTNYKMAWGDWDNDGIIDFLYQNGSTAGAGIGFRKGLGDGTFIDIALSASPFRTVNFTGYTMFSTLGSVFTADYDNDGDLDIIDRGTTPGVFRNDRGTMTYLKGAADPIGDFTGQDNRMVMGDWDGDGDLDILFQNSDTAGTGFGYKQNNGSGVFTTIALSASPFKNIVFTGMTLNGNAFAFDYDNDGDIDLIDRDNVKTFRNDNGVMVAVTDVIGGFAANTNTRILFGDWDNDGDVDALYQSVNSPGAGFGFKQNNGSGVFVDIGLGASPFAAYNFSGETFIAANYFVVDYDNDGDIDLVDRSVNRSIFKADGAPPKMTAATPTDNSIGVRSDANIVLTFDATVSQGNGTIKIYRASDNVLIETISASSAQVTGSGTSWTIDPSVTLANSTEYYVKISQSSFVDAGGKAFQGILNKTALSFTTKAAPTPPVVTAGSGSAAFVEGANVTSTPVAIAPALTVTDGDSATLVSATVSITGGYQATQDLLALSTATGIGNITASYADGVLSLASAGGTATLAQWQAALRAVTYTNGSDTPDTTARTISFAVNDGDFTSTTATRTVTVAAANDAPSGANATVTLAEDTAYIVSANDFGFTDIDGNVLLAVKITQMPAAGQLLYDADGPGGSAAVAVTLTQTISRADLDAGKLTFVPAANANGSGYASIGFAVQDNGGTANGGRDIDQSPNTLTFDVAAMNDAPVVDLNTGTDGVDDTNVHLEGGGATGLGAAIAVSDPDNAQMHGATITLTDPVAGDTLIATLPLPAGISIDPSSTTNQIILVGTASASAYATALGQLGFNSSSDDPTLAGARGSRVVTVRVNDGTIDSAPATMNLTVIGYNDEPTLTATATNPTFTEGGTAADLFSNVTASTVEAGQTLRGMTLTITNVTDGAAEKLMIDGSSLALTNGNSEKTAGYGIAVGVTLSGTTAMISFAGESLSAARLAAIVDGLSYTNTSEAPTPADRVVTITALVDSGSNTAPNDNVAALNIASTVTVVAVNDAPAGATATITATEDVARVLSVADFGFTDIDGNALLAVKIATLATAGTLWFDADGAGGNAAVAVTEGQSISAADIAAGKLSFTAAANANGVAYASFTFQVSDNGGTANGGVDIDGTARTLTIDVTAVNDAVTGSPAIGGTLVENQTLTASTLALADADGLGAFHYQWQHYSGGNWSNVGGDAATYTLGAGDVGTTLRVTVSYTDGGNTLETVTSLATGPIASAVRAPQVVHDTVGDRLWDSITTNFDAGDSIATQTALLDNGGTWVNTYDTTNSSATAWQTSHYTPSNQLIQTTVTNDNGTHSVTVYDVDNAYSWTQLTLSFDASWNQTGLSGVRDNGSTTVTQADTVTAMDTLLWFADPYDPDFTSTGFADSLTGGANADSLYGFGGNDTLDGKAGNDVIIGGRGNDLLTGGAGDDRFVFNLGDGNDTITDFAAGNGSGDRIDLHGYGIADFNALVSRMVQQGDDVLITLDSDNQLVLGHVTLANLNAGDFHFS